MHGFLDLLSANTRSNHNPQTLNIYGVELGFLQHSGLLEETKQVVLRLKKKMHWVIIKPLIAQESIPLLPKDKYIKGTQEPTV